MKTFKEYLQNGFKDVSKQSTEVNIKVLKDFLKKDETYPTFEALADALWNFEPGMVVNKDGDGKIYMDIIAAKDSKGNLSGGDVELPKDLVDLINSKIK